MEHGISWDGIDTRQTLHFTFFPQRSLIVSAVCYCQEQNVASFVGVSLIDGKSRHNIVQGFCVIPNGSTATLNVMTQQTHTLVPEAFFYTIFFVRKFATRSADGSAEPERKENLWSRALRISFSCWLST